MRSLVVLSGQPNYIQDALERSEFPTQSAVVLGEGSLSIPHTSIGCPSLSGPARTAIAVMQFQKVEAVIMCGEVDFDLLDLALSLNLPVYIHYVTDEYVVGLRMGWEEDF